MQTKFINQLRKIKSKLPFNGDWLFVTADIPLNDDGKDHEQINDLALEYNSIEKVLKDISNGKKNLDLIYEKTKEYESFIASGADLVRDKAKTLLNTSSFVSAILFGSSTFLLSTITELNFWTTIEIIIYVLLVQHFVRSLLEAVRVLTKEEAVYMSPKEFIELAGLPKKDQLKNFISRSIVYANITDKYVWKRSDRLIKGQHAFRYGLIFSAILLVIHLCNNIYKNENFNERIIQKITFIEQGLDKSKKENENYIARKIDSAFSQVRTANNVDTIPSSPKTARIKK